MVDLTPDGRALITQVFATHKQAMDRAAQGLSKAERGTLIALLKKLGTTAEHQLAEGGRES
jgi:MarR family 2-MHQ and catechol resistance regulon transcriptional repressor